MLALAAGFVIVFLIGLLCRRFDIPLPAPPTLGGALLILCLTFGYWLGQWALLPTR